MKNSDKKNSYPREFQPQDLDEQLNSTTIERKKKKGGIYEYFVADYDGKIVKKIPHTIGRQLEDGFYEFIYYNFTPTYEKKATTASEHGIFESMETRGGNECELKAIFSGEGDLIMEGIRNIITYNSKRVEFVIELEPLFHIEEAEKSIKKGRSTRIELGMMDKPLRCVIDECGEYIVEPTTKNICFDKETNSYVLSGE
jgi:hypothetical protein